MRVGLTYNLKREIGGNTPFEGRASGKLPGGAALPEDFYLECDAPETVGNVRDALAERHEEVIMIEADEDAFEKLRSSRPDMVFNMAEGVWGADRESQMPAIMEMLRIPYTGSAPLTLALCLNKGRAKEILSHYGIPTPRYFLADTPSSVEHGRLDFPFPMIVKPLVEGSSKGIKNDCLVKDKAELVDRVARITKEYRQPGLVEEFLPGREFTVAILGNGSEVRALPIVEINYSSLPKGINPIYSYEAKWVLDTPETPLDIFTCPAAIDGGLKKAIEKAAIDAYKALDVKDWCRIDIRLDSKGAPSVLELNPLPGILMDPKCNSCFPKAARSEGMTFSGLVNAVVEIARRRYGI
ncbi:MAG: ATP-grasp domain-containing protein [Deltaproteobacteria bacterium]|nr:ATP-grasp domain-containing protein [Deltaproteobacteria bacterium]